MRLRVFIGVLGCLAAVLCAPPSANAAPSIASRTPQFTACGHSVSYRAAQEQWIGSSLWGGSALQNMDIPIVITELVSVEKTHCANPTDLSKTVAALKDFGSLPVSGYTAALNARAQADQTTISNFLEAQPDSSGCYPLKGAQYAAAIRAWESQPRTSRLGVKSGLLREAAADLQRSSQAHIGDTGCDPAAISDLLALASTTPAKVASGARMRKVTLQDCSQFCQVVTCVRTVEGNRVAYLNGFFNAMPSTSVPPKEFRSVLAPSGCQ